MESLRQQGYQLRGPLPWLLATCMVTSAIALIFAPADGQLWSAVRILGAMLLMLCMGVVIAHNAPIWEKSKADPS